MLFGLLVAIAFAPIFWILVPQGYRKEALTLVSLVLLGIVDLRLPVVIGVLVVTLYAAGRGIGRAGPRPGHWIVGGGLLLLALLFVLNKSVFGGDSETALPSQAGIALIGTSYFVLKAASILIEVRRKNLDPPGIAALARWLCFFPIFASGPIEAFKHFDDQEPRVDPDRIMWGLERILFGCLRALVVSHYLAIWTTPIVQDPAGHSALELVLALYGVSFRIYFDFAGYSDIAIGLSALYGYRIQENFDRPFLQRNIVDLWQRWHMTLTGWLRFYLFTPYARSIMKRGRAWHGFGIMSGQILTMVACGLWHEITPAFALWGGLHGAALVWVGSLARPTGRRLPPQVVAWWRKSRLAYGISVLLTVTVFSAINIFAVTNLPAAARFYAVLFGS